MRVLRIVVLWKLHEQPDEEAPPWKRSQQVQVVRLDLSRQGVPEQSKSQS